MFCPKCGNAEQKENSFCRRCGIFLPDFDKLKSREIPPEQHFIANSVLNAMSGIVSLTLAILLYAFFLGKEDTPPLIYITAGFLTAIFFWQAQIFWRTLQLKKQFPKLANQTRNADANEKSAPEFKAAETRELLKEAGYENIVPPLVTEETTRSLRSSLKIKNRAPINTDSTD